MSMLSHIQGSIDVSWPTPWKKTTPLILLQTDWAAVAAENGLKDASIAKVRWGQIRRKKIEGKTPTPKVAGGKRKNTEAQNEIDSEETPTKKKKARELGAKIKTGETGEMGENMVKVETNSDEE